MATKKEEIVAIAEAQGYEGDTPQTIAEAVNALGSVMGDYELPAATATMLGGVKVGDGLSVESDGTLSASGGADIMRVTFTAYQTYWRANKESQEIVEHINNGGTVDLKLVSTLNGTTSSEVGLMSASYNSYTKNYNIELRFEQLKGWTYSASSGYDYTNAYIEYIYLVTRSTDGASTKNFDVRTTKKITLSD